jgi:hypothetical protein
MNNKHKTTITDDQWKKWLISTWTWEMWFLFWLKEVEKKKTHKEKIDDLKMDLEIAIESKNEARKRINNEYTEKQDALSYIYFYKFLFWSMFISLSIIILVLI